MKRIKSLSALVLCLGISLSMLSCNRSKKQSEEKQLDDNTPTSGKISFYTDESFQPLIESAKFTFEHTYPNASFNINYSTEAEAVSKFLSYKSPVVILARKFSDDELKDFRQKGYRPEQFPMATDALAFVVNNQNPDSFIAYNQMLEIISGKCRNWNQLDRSNTGDISIVFDKNNSSTATYLIDSVLHHQPLPQNCYAAGSDSAIMDYVRKNAHAIGVIALNWISDKNDPKVIEALKGLTIIALSSSDDSINYYKPVAQNLQQGLYPFIRTLYFINAEGHNGLGTGFAAYLASDRGQTIIHRFGLEPAKQIKRTIETRKSF